MPAKARLHWFWRGAIAVAAGLCLGVLLCRDLVPGYHWLARHVIPVVDRLTGLADMYNRVLALFVLPSVAMAVIVYSLLTRRLGTPAPDGELHCRECNHILRGLSEPRCPERGEAI